MGTGSTKQESLPWGPQAKRFKNLFAEADKYLNQTLEYYPNSTVAPRNQWEIMANQNVANLVQGGSPALQSALAENQRTTEGYYLSPFSNPYLRQVGDTAAEDIGRAYNRNVLPGITSRFAAAGRSGGPTTGVNSAEAQAISASQRDLGQELSQMYANLYGGAYEAERGRMPGAVQMAPGLRQAEFADQAALQAAGRDEFQYAQLQLSDLVNRFNFQQYEPYERMGLYQGLISQPQGYGTSKNTSKLGTAQYIGMASSALMPSISSLIGGGGDSGMTPPGGLG